MLRVLSSIIGSMNVFENEQFALFSSVRECHEEAVAKVAQCNAQNGPSDIVKII